MIKESGLKDDLKAGRYERNELSPTSYFAPQSGGPRGYSLQFDDDDERDPWDYDDYRDDDEDDEEDDYLKDEDDYPDDDLDDEADSRPGWR